jgi:23S rRNA pseudouridine1911/1915/1917 synthase
VEKFPHNFIVMTDDAGKRLDQFLTGQLGNTSRARVQQLIDEQKVLVNESAGKASLRLRGGERITVLGAVTLAPLRAMAELIPLDIV